MFEQFTERARRVIILAREEAGRSGHNHVGTEHLLFGILQDGEGVATVVLQRFGLQLKMVQAEVKRALAKLPKTPAYSEVPFTPQAKRVLELSIEESQQLRHNYIGTEHLLLGLMKDGQSIAAKILESRGVRFLDEIRQATMVLLAEPASTDLPLAFRKLPLTPEAKRVLKFSLEEASRLGHELISAE